MHIAFIHQGQAMLPELEAYRSFFKSRGHTISMVTKQNNPVIPVDVEWHFMGFGGKRLFPGSVLIHEYASASVPPFSSGKDLLKRRLNAKPDFRIFQNELVRKLLGFHDRIPFGFREMGVNLDQVRNLPQSPKEVDFIYPGTLAPYSYFRKLFKKFATGELSDQTLLVISDLDAARQSEWRDYKNIIFRPRMSNSAVLAAIKTARFGINLRPDVRPFRFQASTKVLEFAACGVPVLSTSSAWLQDFRKAHGGNYFILSPGLENFTPGNVESFQFEFPSMESFSWEQQIARSGISQFLGIDASINEEGL